tara:strand:- start:11424 stop:12266 length:843 start_codon:yes stop_codon:yes gene_type:complete
MRNSKCLVFDHTVCDLGEGAIWLESCQSFAWLDILSRQVYEKSLAGPLRRYRLSFTATAILPPENADLAKLRLVADNGVYELDLESGGLLLLSEISLPSSHRTNDAGIDPDGRIVFGVMEWQPTGLHGWISRIEKNGQHVKLIEQVGIANTITWSECGQVMYYADSFKQVMYAVNYSGLSVVEFYSLANTLATPDGSCEYGGCLYTAEWDGWRIAKRCMQSGQLLAELLVPAPRPTSCAIYNDRILITTARTELSEVELKAAPDSGKTFVAKLNDFVDIA